ncbi:MAG: hypothetical protein R3Y56_02920 [Akkermansia sp.]
MSEEQDHHDGLAHQRQALEQMSQDLSRRLQEMIVQQEQRAHEFNALVPHAMPELLTPQEETSASPTLPQTPLPPLPPQAAPSYQQESPVLSPATKPSPRPQQAKPRRIKPPVGNQEEGSIGPVAIGIIVFAIFIVLKSCS